MVQASEQPAGTIFLAKTIADQRFLERSLIICDKVEIARNDGAPGMELDRRSSDQNRPLIPFCRNVLACPGQERRLR
jgi:hypothetical protein